MTLYKKTTVPEDTGGTGDTKSNKEIAHDLLLRAAKRVLDTLQYQIDEPFNSAIEQLRASVKLNEETK